MVHRQSRDKLAEALRHYVAGQITNDQLHDVPIESGDRGVVAVKQMAWHLYDDMSTHRAVEKHHLDKSARREIARWIAFLYSDEEYIWPEYSLIQIVNWPMNMLTFGWWERMKQRKWQRFVESGDSSVWPFFSRREFKEVIRKPKLLSGGTLAKWADKETPASGVDLSNP